MTEIKAKFAQLTAKQGKTALQLELDEACAWALPELVEMAGRQVIVTIDDPQQRIPMQQDEPEPEPLPFGGLLQGDVEDAEDVEEGEVYAAE